MSGISLSLRQLWSGKRALFLLILLSILPGLFLLWLATQREGAPSSTEAKSKEAPAKVEPIEGSDLKRVVLTEKAAERIALQTATVREAQVTREREVGGQVVALPEAGAGRVLVRVPFSESDLAKIDRSRPAIILPLDDEIEDSDEEAEELEAEAVDDVEDDDERSVLYFSVSSAGRPTMAVGRPVRVKLALTTNAAQYKIVPYQAVIYDVDGGTWVYVKEPNALAFVRQSVTIDYIEGDLAFLVDGPPAGTEVVTVGGAELYGTETGVSK
jgi:hypothetical protein